MPRRGPLRRAGRALGWLGTGAALGATAVAGYATWTLNGPQRPWPPYFFTPFEIGAEAEDVAFTSDDGVPLAGWFLDRPDSDLVVVVCHGHRGNKSEMLGIGPGLWRAGHAVLLFDFRGCGDSGDGPQSLAHHEQRDLKAAIDFVAQRRPDATIAVLGFSMGAATTLLTAAGDERVRIVVVDSPFATMGDVVGANLRRFRLPSAALLPAVDLANRARYGYAFAQVRPVDAMVALAPRPVLLLHGTDDRIIPYAHARQLVEAAAPGTVEMVTFEGVDHCGGYFEDRPGYIARVDAFLRRHSGLQPVGDDAQSAGSG